MAKKMKPGQKRCPSCGATVSRPENENLPEVRSRIQRKATERPRSQSGTGHGRSSKADEEWRQAANRQNPSRA